MQNNKAVYEKAEATVIVFEDDIITGSAYSDQAPLDKLE